MQGAEVLHVRWFVNGGESESGPLPFAFPLSTRGQDPGKREISVSEERRSCSTTPEVSAVECVAGVTDVRIEPRAPTSGSTVKAIPQGQDADGDPLTYKYKWYVNDLPVAGESESLVLNGVKKGAWVHVSVTPNDGFADGAWKESSRYQVVNAPPVVKSPVPTTIPPSMMLRHTIVAEDPDGDPMTFTLYEGTAGDAPQGVDDRMAGTRISHRDHVWT